MSTTLTLLRQDPVRPGLLRAGLSSLALGMVLRIPPDLSRKVSELTVDDLPGGFTPMYLVSTATVMTFVLAANAWTRSSRLALGLPISTGRAWAVRTAALIGVGLVSVAALALALGLSADPAGGIVMNPVIALAAARAAAAVVLALFLFQLPQPERHRIPPSAPYVAHVAFSGGIVLVSSSLAIPSAWGTLAFLLLALALGVGLYLRLPPTFSVGPTVAESLEPAGTEAGVAARIPTPAGDLAAEREDRHPALLLHRVVFGALKSNLLIWFLLAVQALSAVVVTAEYLDGVNAFVPLLFLMAYHLPLVQAALEGMRPFDPLPVSRRLLWAHSVIPTIVAVALGAGLAMIGRALNPQPYSHVRFSDCRVEVPWEYLELSRDGRTPTVTAAWGESVTPRLQPLWPGLALSLYDPYEVSRESSPRFVELQMRRAVEAVYGVPVPAELSGPDYRSPPKVEGDVERGAFTLAAARGRASEDRSRTAAVALLVLTLVGTALVVLALLQYGPSVHRKVFRWVLLGLLGLAVVAAAAISAASLLGFTDLWHVGALLSIGFRSLAHWLPLPTVALWVAWLAAGVGGYLLTERVFAAIELPRERTMNRFAEEY